MWSVKLTDVREAACGRRRNEDVILVHAGDRAR